MRPTRTHIAMMTSIALAGCATRAVNLAPDRPDRPWVPATDASGTIKAGTTPATGGDRTYSLPANPALGALPPPDQIDAQHAYTLPELVDIAETSNPLSRVAWNEAKEMALSVGLVRSAYLPRLTATAAGIVEASHSSQRLDGLTADGSGNGRSALSALSLDWLLFDFGQRRALVGAAEQLSVASNIRFDAIHQKIVHDVSVAFYAASFAHAETVNAERSLADAIDVQTAVEARRAKGQTTVVEVAQAREASAQARLGSVQAHGHEMDARITLLTAMGVSPLTPIRLADIPYRPLAPQDSADAAAAVSHALERRPDMLAALATEKAASAGIAAARADFRPKIFLSTGASYQTGHLDVTALPGAGGTDGTDNLTGNSRSVHAIIGVTIPLYDGGMRAAHLEQAKARAEGAAAQLDTTRDSAVHEIVVARTSLETGVAAYDAATELLGAAQTSFDAALGAYRNGVGNLTSVSLAEAALMSARSARSGAYSTALSAAATLALATGKLSATPGLSDGP